MTSQSDPKGGRLALAPSQLQFAFDPREGTGGHIFESLSEFREACSKIIGTPGGDVDHATALRLGWIETPIGPMIAGSHEGFLIFLEYTTRERMVTQIEALRRRFKTPFVLIDDAILRQTRTELGEYFAGNRRDFTIPLRYPGTPFEERVWSALLKIPYGETRSYESLAMITSTKEAVRAVGSANGRNRIAIVIPCHRVINKGGGLGGYGGGLWRKRALLALEQGIGIQKT
jgi:AraC family transcriptional regulator of adaptative response/methylated-DNA-[protein]-cysteine methyltransferase